MKRLTIWYRGEEISEDIELTTERPHPFGRSQYRLVHNESVGGTVRPKNIGWCYCESPETLRWRECGYPEIEDADYTATVMEEPASA